MSDTYTNLNGHPIKLIDNGDGTFSFATQLSGSSIPSDQPIPTSLVGSLTNVISVTQTSGANAAQTITINAVADKSHYIVGFEVAIKAAAAVTDIDVVLNDGATAKWSTVIGAGAAIGTRVGMMLPYPIKMTAATAVTLVVDAGGASVVTLANIAYYTA